MNKRFFAAALTALLTLACHGNAHGHGGFGGGFHGGGFHGGGASTAAGLTSPPHGWRHRCMAGSTAARSAGSEEPGPASTAGPRTSGPRSTMGHLLTIRGGMRA